MKAQLERTLPEPRSVFYQSGDSAPCPGVHPSVDFLWWEKVPDQIYVVIVSQGEHAGFIFPPLTWEGALDELFEQLQVAVFQLSLYVDLGQQRVAAAKLALQVLGAPQALELTVDHDCKPGAQGLALLHAGEGRK